MRASLSAQIVPTVDDDGWQEVSSIRELSTKATGQARHRTDPTGMRKGT